MDGNKEGLTDIARKVLNEKFCSGMPTSSDMLTDIEHKESIELALSLLNKAILLAAESDISITIGRYECPNDLVRSNKPTKGLYVTTFKAEYIKHL